MQKPARSKGEITTIINLQTFHRITLDDYGLETFEENQFPLAYLITFRTYGTWLHGDDRGAVDRRGGNEFGATLMPPNRGLRASMAGAMPSASLTLADEMRKTVATASRTSANAGAIFSTRLTYGRIMCTPLCQPNAARSV